MDAKLSRDIQIPVLASVIGQLRRNLKEENIAVTPERLASDVRDYAGDCFDAWYRFRPRNVPVGVIQNDECVTFHAKLVECMDDASHAFAFDTDAHDMMTARLLSRWININSFSK